MKYFISNDGPDSNKLRILIIEVDDVIPENEHYFKGKRFNSIFIHEDNKCKYEFKLKTQHCIEVLGYKFGEYYEYK